MTRQEYIKKHGRKALTEEIKRLEDRRDHLINIASFLHEEHYPNDPAAEHYKNLELTNITERMFYVESKLLQLGSMKDDTARNITVKKFGDRLKEFRVIERTYKYFMAFIKYLDDGKIRSSYIRIEQDGSIRHI